KVIPIPQPEMKEFVPSEKQPLEMKPAQTTIELDEPLRHPVVVGMFSLAHELDPAATRRCPRTAVHRTPVGRHCCHRRIAVSDQPEADRVVRQARCGSAEHRPD